MAWQALRQGGTWNARRIDLANHATMFGDDELKSPPARRFEVGPAMLWTLLRGLAQEIGHTAARLSGRYDVAVTSGRP